MNLNILSTDMRPVSLSYLVNDWIGPSKSKEMASSDHGMPSNTGGLDVTSGSVYGYGGVVSEF